MYSRYPKIHNNFKKTLKTASLSVRAILNSKANTPLVAIEMLLSENKDYLNLNIFINEVIFSSLNVNSHNLRI